MWNKSISLPVKKNDPTINDNGIMMEETYEFIGGSGRLPRQYQG